MSRLKLFFLGAPRIELDAEPVEIELRKGVALLAYLAVTGESHSRDTLSTLLWPDSDQGKARSYLRHALWLLRKALGEEWLEISREQVGLNPEADIWLDVRTFKEGAGAAAEDVTGLAGAVALYRDDFLSGFTLPDAPEFDDWQFFQTEALRERLAAALERLVKGLSQSGKPEQALWYGRRWVELDPLHEPAQRSLIWLYAEAGQQAAALRQYEQYVALLEAEFGLSPEEETLTLYEAVKARRMVAPLLKMERSRKDEGKGLAASRQISSEAAPVRHNLPAQSSPFIGREQELDDICHLLIDEPACRLLVLVGPGGIGKTRLAIQAAHRVGERQGVPDRFQDGILFVPLASVISASGLMATIAQAAGISYYDDLLPRQQLLNYFQDKRILLLLDNFEQLLSSEYRPESLSILTELLNVAPAIKILVTSREALYLREAWLKTLAGLSLPEAADSLESSIEQYDAIRMFEQSARRARLNFSLKSEGDNVVRICRFVGGMPLAIELAADWLRVLSVKGVADQLEQNLDILTARVQNMPERHRSMRIVLEQSWKLLDETEREILKRLSILEGGFRQEAAEKITDASLENLAALVEKSWLSLTDGGRYQIHELLRQFTLEKLNENREALSETETRHGQYFLMFLKQRVGQMSTRGQKAVLVEIQEERRNIQIGWYWALTACQVALLEQVLDGLFNFYQMMSYFEEGEETFKNASYDLQKCEPATEFEAIKGRMLSRHGAFCLALSDYETAKELLHQGLVLARKSGDLQEESFVLGLLGEATRIQGEYSEAVGLLQESMKISQKIGDRLGMARSLQRLAWTVEEEQGDCIRARAYLQQALSLYQAAGRRADVAFCLDKLGHNAWKLGNYAESERLHQESLAIFREIEDQLGIANNLGGLGLVALSRGGAKLEAAGKLLEESLLVCRKTGHLREEANRLRMLTLHANATGDYEKAKIQARETLALSERIGYDHGVIISLVDLGEVALGQGDLKACRDYLLQARQHGLEKSKIVEMTEALTIWAMLLMRESQLAPEEACQKQEKAVEILSLVINHSATWQLYKDKASALMVTLAAQLPPQQVAAAEKQGRHRKWDEVVLEMVSDDRSTTG